MSHPIRVARSEPREAARAPRIPARRIDIEERQVSSKTLQVVRVVELVDGRRLTPGEPWRHTGLAEPEVHDCVGGMVRMTSAAKQVTVASGSSCSRKASRAAAL